MRGVCRVSSCSSWMEWCASRSFYSLGGGGGVCRRSSHDSWEGERAEGGLTCHEDGEHLQIFLHIMEEGVSTEGFPTHRGGRDGVVTYPRHILHRLVAIHFFCTVHMGCTANWTCTRHGHLSCRDCMACFLTQPAEGIYLRCRKSC